MVVIGFPGGYYLLAMKNEPLHYRRLALTLVGAILLGLVLRGVRGAAASEGDIPIQQAVTPSPSPQGQVNLPTATATTVGGPTATPSRTPTLTPVLAQMVGDPTNLRSGPGLDFDIVASLDIGTQLPLIGRWLGYDWLLVKWDEAPGGQAWVYAPLVVVVGDITTVPAVEPPQLPTIDPTQAVIQATATVLLQTPGAAETATAQALFLPTGVYTQTPGVASSSGGSEPTFTVPAPLNQPDVIGSRGDGTRSGIPPAVIIISLGAMGVLTLLVGLVRRL